MKNNSSFRRRNACRTDVGLRLRRVRRAGRRCGCAASLARAYRRQKIVQGRVGIVRSVSLLGVASDVFVANAL